MSKDLPDIFVYSDFRKFLADYYAAQKQLRPSFSYRHFARVAGFSSPNYLKLVIDGKRKLSQEMATRFAAACGLRHEAARYFEQLVRFNQATFQRDKDAAYLILKKSRRGRNAFKLEEAHAVYHSQWFIAAVRELIDCRDFREDPTWIAETLRPTITVKEAQLALRTLIELKFVVRDEQGRMRQANAVLHTASEPKAFYITTFHKQMLERASQAIDIVHPQDRDISAVTMTVRVADIAEIKQRIQQFRKEMIECYGCQDQGDHVGQINIQFFPLSHVNLRSKS